MNSILRLDTPFTLPNLSGLTGFITQSALTLSFIILCNCTLLNIAHANYDLTMSLQIGKLDTTQYGKTQFTPVTVADTGEVIQYRATYSNPSDTTLEDIFVTFPIPYKMTFTGEAYPASAQATIDGVNYADIPLLQHAEGTLELVPYTQYKSLRWHIKHLPAHKSATIYVNAVVEEMP